MVTTLMLWERAWSGHHRNGPPDLNLLAYITLNDTSSPIPILCLIVLLVLLTLTAVVK